ncbi:MAG TPA: hypothetical protein VM052_00235 [Candidatus Limnocylindrales bacterium]|nr:hypothetical protein [Candidatus Limnocylindrales bacterium]
MLAALTVRRRIVSPRRLAIAAASLLITVAVVSAGWTASSPQAITPSLADELEPATWAVTIPTAWLAAPVPPVRRGEAIDLLALRTGDKAYVIPIAYGVVVVSVSDRGILLEVDETDATAIGSARAGGMLLLPLLRSTR